MSRVWKEVCLGGLEIIPRCNRGISAYSKTSTCSFVSRIRANQAARTLLCCTVWQVKQLRIHQWSNILPVHGKHSTNPRCSVSALQTSCVSVWSLVNLSLTTAAATFSMVGHWIQSGSLYGLLPQRPAQNLWSVVARVPRVAQIARCSCKKANWQCTELCS